MKLEKEFLQSFLILSLAIGSSAFAQRSAPAPQMSYLHDSYLDSVMSTTLAPFGEEGRDAPAFMRNDIRLVYNTPSPSQVKPELIGPVQFIRTARVNEDAGEVTFPLYHGHNADGKSAWYILTDVSNRDIADHLGLAFSAKLPYADHGKAVRTATLDSSGAFVFERGSINFSPERSLTPGSAQAFPPAAVQPGSVADADYTPFVKVNGVYYNAPVIAFGVEAAQLQAFASGNVDHKIVHDKVVKIDPKNKTVTLKVTVGYSFAKPIFYLSTESNDPVGATLEASTLTPSLNDANQDIPDASTGQGNERIAIIVNGPQGIHHPFRQGLVSAITDHRDPINIFGGVPTINLDYSPLWDAEMVEWTGSSISHGFRTRIIDLFQLFDLEKKGVVQGFGGGVIKRSGILINCPVIARLI